ncbi:MAG TPA: TetR family transcriptional regulator C-terminal domain-containing protein [Cyclobacteriaceae bacterium]|nr:TetR family transcriptional regulator C-terminal domain-containing protein [Cyclobacteriaceae bacterium]
METTKKRARTRTTRGSKTTSASTDKIRSAYTDYLLTEGKQPPSVYKFCLDLGIKEEAFYNQFGSFDAVERDIWAGFINTAISRLQSDKTWSTFTSREKILSFYFGLFEELKNNRSFAIQQLGTFRKPELTPTYLKDFKKAFVEFIESALNQGKSNGEVSPRPYLDRLYPNLFWMHTGFLLLYWREDESAGFEKTDAAIEKSVNLAFDLIGKGAIDSAFDFAKFLYQSRK